MPDDKTLAELFVEIKVQNEQLLKALKDAEVKSHDSTKKMQSHFDSLNFSKFILGALGIYGLRQALYLAKRALLDVTNTASDFEYQIARSNTILLQNSSNLERISKTAREAAMALGVNPAGYAEALYEALSANVALGDAIGFTNTSARLGISGFTDTKVAIDLLTTAYNSYGKEIGTVEEVASKFIHVQNRGKVVINELADSLGRLIPFAATLGVEFSTLNGMVSSLTASGLDAFETATALRSMMQALATPSELQRKVWKALKIEWGESRLAGNGMVQVLKEINEKTSGSITLANALGINQRGLVALLQLGGKGYGLLTRDIEENRKATNLLNDATNVMNDTWKRTIESLSSSFKGYIGTIGDMIIRQKDVNYLLKEMTEFLRGAARATEDLELINHIQLYEKKVKDTKQELDNLYASLSSPQAVWAIDETKIKAKIDTLNVALAEYRHLLQSFKDEYSKSKGVPKKEEPELPVGTTGKGLTDKELDAKLKSIDDEENAKKEATKRERERQQELESYTREWVRRQIDYWEKLYEKQFELDMQAEKNVAKTEKRKEDLRIKRMDTYYKTFEQENKMELARIEAQRKYDLAMEDINFKTIMDKNSSLDDGYKFERQLLTEHLERIKEINDNANGEIEDADRQHLYNKISAINSFADRYGDFLGQTVIQSKLSFDAIKNAFSAMLSQMVAQIVGRAVIWQLLSMLSGGSVAAPGFMNIVKDVVGLKGFQTGGYTGMGSMSKVAGVVHRGEFVFDKPSVDTLGVQMLNALKNIGSGVTDNRQFNLSFTDRKLAQDKQVLANNLRELWREGSLNFMTV